MKKDWMLKKMQVNKLTNKQTKTLKRELQWVPKKSGENPKAFREMKCISYYILYLFYLWFP